MQNRLSILFFSCMLANGFCGNAQQTKVEPGALVASNDSLRLISRQFRFTEGPAADKKGNIYFTDQPNDRIWKYSTSGRLTLFLEGTRRANGLHIDRRGNIVACSDEYGQICSINPRKKIEVLTEKQDGQQLNGPNDLWIAPDGIVYFTDPYYRRPYHTVTMPKLKKEAVYYLLPGSRTALVADSTLAKPNGIEGTPDGRYLYVADIKDNKTYRYTIQPDGTLAGRTLFAAQGSDGMTLDNRGNVYLTGNGITVYDSTGNKITQIPIPEKWTANLCFGGKKGDQLFITASEGFYVLPMNVKGAEYSR